MHIEERLALEAKLQELYDRNNISMPPRSDLSIRADELRSIFSEEGLSAY